MALYRRPVGNPTITVRSVASSTTLTLGDAGGRVEVDSASAAVVTIPPHSDVALPLRTTIEIAQVGAGQITGTAGVGVTARAPYGQKTIGQYSSMFIFQQATDVWWFSGDVTT